MSAVLKSITKILYSFHQIFVSKLKLMWLKSIWRSDPFSVMHRLKIIVSTIVCATILLIYLLFIANGSNWFEGGCAVNGFFPQPHTDVMALMKSQTVGKTLQEIRDKWLHPPTPLSEPYGFTLEPNDWHTIKHMHQTILHILDYKKNGFFVEAGALDGVYLSNTLHLEMDHDWSGLLVEADPKTFQKLKANRRKAWSINACLALKPVAEKVRMTRILTMDALSAISDLKSSQFRRDPKAENFETQCFPFVSILAAVRKELVVDYFSLDIEGAEMSVLKTIPWQFVYIKVMSVEVNQLSAWQLTTFLRCKGFELIEKFSGKYIDDYLFVNQRYVRERKMEQMINGTMEK